MAISSAFAVTTLHPTAGRRRESSSGSVRISWHQFDLPKCQVHRGNAAIYLNGHFGGLFDYFLHFAPKTSERTIDDPYDLAFAHLPMFSHMTTPLFVRPALAGARQAVEV